MKSKFNGILTLLLALSVQFIFAQKTVTGTVSDENTALPGVSVVIKGTKTGTETDFNGKYSIQAKAGDVLQFSYVGMDSAERTVGAANVYDVTLTSSKDNVLDEVVIIGYGTQKRSDVTASVAKINAEVTRGVVAPSFETMIAGQSSGVQITQPNGIIGVAPSINIRGMGSINSGSYPLIVVDGMVIYSGDTGGYASTNSMTDINPSDIESFEILKDGAATAIYGSRGANGVIMITTKKGKKGTMKVSYNNVTGFASPVKYFDLLETPDFLVISNEKRTNRGQTPWAVGNQFNTNWQKAVLQNNALQIDHNLSLNGGNDKTLYFLSIGYTNQDGVAVANHMNRLSMRTNVETKVFDWFTIGGNVAITRTQYNGLNTGIGSLSGNIFNAIRQLPNTPIYNPAHPTGYNLGGGTLNNSHVGQWLNTDPIGDNISNIVYVLDHNIYYSKANRSIVSAFASADLFKGLNYRLQVGADNPLTSGFLYWNPIHGDGSSTNGRLQNSNVDLTRWNVQNILSYNQSFVEKHNLGLTAVVEYQKERNQSFFGVGTNLSNEFYNQNLVNNAYATQESGGGITEQGIVSYLGRLSYNYNQKYYLQGSLRRDGLSKLPPATRRINFTGYSGGWNIANEKFFEGLKSTINELKLRASYSSVGNTELGSSYPYLGLTVSSPYSGENGIAFGQMGNDLLEWETSNKIDYGFDLSLFKSRVRLVFDYFENDINGMVMSEPVSPSLGIPNNTIKKNIGSMLNTGYEFTLDYSVFKNNNFTWDISSNLTLQDNVVKTLPNNNADIVGGSYATDSNLGPNLILRQNESFNSIYGYQYWGVNPANGNPVYYKANGTLVQGNLATSTYFVFDPANPTNMTTASTLITADKKVLGNTLPTYYGSFGNKFRYKNLDLNAFFRFSGGNKIFNATRRELMNQNLNNNGSEILGRWQSVSNPGDGWTPRLWASTNTFTNLSGHASTRFLEDGDFISLDNLSLGYRLPKNFTDKIKIENIRLFAQAQNLLIITKYTGINPEMNFSGIDYNGTPRAKVLSIGVNVNL